ncbi:tyrosine-type recombinase/integrase [Massilia horti]|uniref:DUF4102 domain-containing protein n=1 Tax=Massilia horti TaxID=2562153 RepID=A0A4Y9SQA1_9BURK|nr:integrase family protein [Massilia horti]TFW28655.1 DUF4102 domain-containing protein [Massilia horti]
MAKIRLTTGKIATFVCGEKQLQAFLWDQLAPGLGVRANPGGAKSFMFQSKLEGKPLRITIGNVEIWTIEAARTEARRLQTIIDGGRDPRKVKADAIAAEQAQRSADAAAAASERIEQERQSVTLGQVWQTYIDDRKAKWSEGHLANHINLSAPGGQVKKRGKGLTVAGPLAPLMNVPLSDLTSDRIASWLALEAETRATNAAQSFRILRAFIRWADDTPAYSGIIPPGAYSARKVRDATPKSETKKDDSIQREQLQLWFKGVKQLTNPIRAAYLQALLLTGARRTELTELLWDNVDFQWQTLYIGDKIEGMRTIPLPPYLSQLLATLPRKNKWVFYSSRSESGHIEEPKDAHAKALTAVGLPHVTIHGLRRSFGTLAEWLDVPIGVVAQINGHKPSALAEKHYRRRPIDILRMWHVRIESWILEQAKIDPPTQPNRPTNAAEVRDENSTAVPCP